MKLPFTLIELTGTWYEQSFKAVLDDQLWQKIGEFNITMTNLVGYAMKHPARGQFGSKIKNKATLSLIERLSSVGHS